MLHLKLLKETRLDSVIKPDTVTKSSHSDFQDLNRELEGKTGDLWEI